MRALRNENNVERRGEGVDMSTKYYGMCKYVRRRGWKIHFS